MSGNLNTNPLVTDGVTLEYPQVNSLPDEAHHWSFALFSEKKLNAGAFHNGFFLYQSPNKKAYLISGKHRWNAALH